MFSTFSTFSCCLSDRGPDVLSCFFFFSHPSLRFLYIFDNSGLLCGAPFADSAIVQQNSEPSAGSIIVMPDCAMGLSMAYYDHFFLAPHRQSNSFLPYMI